MPGAQQALTESHCYVLSVSIAKASPEGEGLGFISHRNFMFSPLTCDFFIF